jgi:hypothetical protein
VVDRDVMPLDLPTPAAVGAFTRLEDPDRLIAYLV